MNYSELKLANPRLFWDGVCRGEISYSEGDALVTGDAAKTPLLRDFLMVLNHQRNPLLIH